MKNCKNLMLSTLGTKPLEKTRNLSHTKFETKKVKQFKRKSQKVHTDYFAHSFCHQHFFVISPKELKSVYNSVF